MKKKILFISIVAILVLCTVFFASCGETDDTDYTKIETVGMTYENGEYKLIVAPSVNQIDLSEKFKVSENAYFQLYCNGFQLDSTIVNLENGNNIFNIVSTDIHIHITNIICV